MTSRRGGGHGTFIFFLPFVPRQAGIREGQRYSGLLLLMTISFGSLREGGRGGERQLSKHSAKSARHSQPTTNPRIALFSISCSLQRRFESPFKDQTIRPSIHSLLPSLVACLRSFSDCLLPSERAWGNGAGTYDVCAEEGRGRG